MTSTKEQARDWAKNNRDRHAVYGYKQRDKLKNETVEAYGGKCTHCGESDPVVLSLDHINDDAHIEKEKYGENARGGHKQYARLKAEGWPKGRFQLLCFNCNAKKEHQRRRDGIFDRWGAEITEKITPRYGKSKASSNSRSGIRGVFWNKQKQKWQASIMFNYQNERLGFFSDLREAVNAWNKRAREIYGSDVVVATEEEINNAIERKTPHLAATLTMDELGL